MNDVNGDDWIRYEKKNNIEVVHRQNQIVKQNIMRCSSAVIQIMCWSYDLNATLVLHSKQVTVSIQFLLQKNEVSHNFKWIVFSDMRHSDVWIGYSYQCQNQNIEILFFFCGIHWWRHISIRYQPTVNKAMGEFSLCCINFVAVLYDYVTCPNKSWTTPENVQVH